MTSARVAAAQARREVAFLEVCEEISDELAAAKRYLRDNPGDAAAIERKREATTVVHEFRKWARVVGQPKEGVPGRDAVIRIGG